MQKKAISFWVRITILHTHRFVWVFSLPIPGCGPFGARNIFYVWNLKENYKACCDCRFFFNILSPPLPYHICGKYSLLTPWCTVLLEQLTGLQLVKKFPAFHGTRMFITALTSVRHLSQASHLWMFLNISVLQGRVVSTSPNPQAGGPPLVGCPQLLIQFIRSCPSYRRPFLYPQPEDAPCSGDRASVTSIILICAQ